MAGPVGALPRGSRRRSSSSPGGTATTTAIDIAFLVSRRGRRRSQRGTTCASTGSTLGVRRTARWRPAVASRVVPEGVQPSKGTGRICSSSADGRPAHSPHDCNCYHPGQRCRERPEPSMAPVCPSFSRTRKPIRADNGNRIRESDEDGCALPPFRRNGTELRHVAILIPIGLQAGHPLHVISPWTYYTFYTDYRDLIRTRLTSPIFYFRFPSKDPTQGKAKVQVNRSVTSQSLLT
jgi:hypothetical protein